MKAFLLSLVGKLASRTRSNSSFVKVLVVAMSVVLGGGVITVTLSQNGEVETQVPFI